MNVSADGRRRVRLAAEYLLLFFGLVGGYALAGSPGSPLPPLAVAAGGTVIYLRRQDGVDRRNLTRAAAISAQLSSMLGRRWLLAAALAVAALALWYPQRLFDLPRQHPLLWAAIVVLYPAVSVYPQELVYRAFLLHRYAPLFGTGQTAALASAAAFGFAHVIFGSALSVGLTLVGGWLFARRYQRTRSLLCASLEHALYGVLAFTVGLGDLFYHGAGRL